MDDFDIFNFDIEVVPIPISIIRKNNGSIYYLELSGYDVNSIEIDINDRIMTIIANKPQPFDDENVIVNSIQYGEYKSSFTIREDITSRDQIKESYKDGVLKIELNTD